MTSHYKVPQYLEDSLYLKYITWFVVGNRDHTYGQFLAKHFNLPEENFLIEGRSLKEIKFSTGAEQTMFMLKNLKLLGKEYSDG